MTKSIQILSVLLLLYSSQAFSQISTDSPKKWGIETELIQPFLPNVGIMDIPLHSTPRFRHKVRQHSDAKYATIPRERLPLIPRQSTPLC